jgi:hypothetical protein
MTVPTVDLSRPDLGSAGTKEEWSMERPKSGRTVAERLDVALLRDLRDDMRFITEERGVIMFAVDAYDVLRYCFPMGPFADAVRSGDVEEQADYFAALSFVLNHRFWRPILLPEYLAELHFFVASLTDRYGKGGYDDWWLLSRVEDEIRSRLPEFPTSSTAADLLDFVKRYFHLVLLLAGAESARMGFKELQRLIVSRLMSLGTLTAQDHDRSGVNDVLRIFATGYRPNVPFLKRCFEAFEKVFDRESHSEEAKRDRADAVAVDRVLQLNAALLQAYRDNRLERPHQVRLLSSSVRLRLLITELAKGPEFTNETYAATRLRVVRVPDQVFAFVIAHPNVPIPTSADTSATEEVLQTIEWLIEIHDRAETLREQSYDNLILDPRLELLEKHRRRVLAPYQDSYENLALFSKMPVLLEQGLGSGAERPTALIGHLRSLLNVADIASLTDKALRAQRELVRVHTILAHRWCVGLEQGVTPDIAVAPPPDQIRGAYHALPWLISTTSVPLLDVVLLTREAFFLHPDDVRARREKLVDAFAALIRVDTAGDSDVRERAEADLIRALLFLAIKDRPSERAAVALARDVRTYGPVTQRVDALYVEIWARRRVGDFEEAERLADQGIGENPKDPRFWHGRALARFGRTRSAQRTAFAFLGLREDLEKALQLYREISFQTMELKLATIAGCLNSLAYVLTLDTSDPRNLVRARERLNELKEFLEREKWRPRFPEFFHTEAFLELHEAKRLPEGAARTQKLGFALKAAEHARQLAPSRVQYAELYEEIKSMI